MTRSKTLKDFVDHIEEFETNISEGQTCTVERFACHSLFEDQIVGRQTGIAAGKLVSRKEK